jgi:hypothetical protein
VLQNVAYAGTGQEKLSCSDDLDREAFRDCAKRLLLPIIARLRRE